MIIFNKYMKNFKKQLGFKNNDNLSPGDMIRKSNEMRQKGLKEYRAQIDKPIIVPINPKSLKYKGIACAI